MGSLEKQLNTLSLGDIFIKSSRLYGRSILLVLLFAVAKTVLIVSTFTSLMALRPQITDVVFHDGMGLISLLATAVIALLLLGISGAFWVEYYYDRLMEGHARLTLLFAGALKGGRRFIQTGLVFLLLCGGALLGFNMLIKFTNNLNIVLFQIVSLFGAYLLVAVFLSVSLSAFPHAVLRRKPHGIFYSISSFKDHPQWYGVVGGALCVVVYLLMKAVLEIETLAGLIYGAQDVKNHAFGVGFVQTLLVFICFPLLIAVSTIFSVFIWFKIPEKYPLRAGYVAYLGKAQYALLTKRKAKFASGKAPQKTAPIDVSEDISKWRLFVQAIVMFPVQRFYLLILALTPVCFGLFWGLKARDLSVLGISLEHLPYWGGGLLMVLGFFYQSHVWGALASDRVKWGDSSFSTLVDLNWPLFLRHIFLNMLVLAGLMWSASLLFEGGVISLKYWGVLFLLGLVGMPLLIGFIEMGSHGFQGLFLRLTRELPMKFFLTILWIAFMGNFFVEGSSYYIGLWQKMDAGLNLSEMLISFEEEDFVSFAFLKLSISWGCLFYIMMVANCFAAQGTEAQTNRKLNRALNKV